MWDYTMYCKSISSWTSLTVQILCVIKKFRTNMDEDIFASIQFAW